jgi:hypothetical protein
MRGMNDAVMNCLMDYPDLTLVKVPAVELACSILAPEN